MKNCNACGYCRHQYLGTGISSGCGCNYTGYCDYQLPRDSRWVTSSETKEKKDLSEAKP